MKRHQLIEKIVAELEVLDDSMAESREKNRDRWDEYTEKMRECAQAREAMRKHLTLKDCNQEKLAHYFEGSLMFESKIIQEQNDIELLMKWLNFMNEEVEEVKL